MDKIAHGHRLVPAKARLRGRLAIRSAASGTRQEHARAERAARRCLERELAGYTSPADLSDLAAILARHDDEEAAEIRAILAAQIR